ncbi:MAG: anti-sigma factor antagonist [Anaerolinea sp.]|nr:anti-sigma factor antagonist [Anaerolinea sp.]
MNVETQETGDVVVVRLVGELDGRTAPQVEDSLVTVIQPGCKVLLEMSGVSYMSSAGLRILLLLYRQITGQNGRVVLVGLQELLRDTMSITGFLDFFEDYESIAEGMAALNQV